MWWCGKYPSYLHGFTHPRWLFRISSINSSTWETFVGPDPIFPRIFRSRGGWSFNWISNWRCLVWILSSSAGSQRVLQLREDQTLLLMEEILQQLIKRLYHYLQGFIPPRWCRISSINSVTCRWLHPELAEELAFLRRLRRLNMKAGGLKSWQKVMLEIKTFCLVLSPFVFSYVFHWLSWIWSSHAEVSVVLNKVDILRDMDVNVEEFTLKMREPTGSNSFQLGCSCHGMGYLSNVSTMASCFLET